MPLILDKPTEGIQPSIMKDISINLDGERTVTSANAN